MTKRETGATEGGEREREGESRCERERGLKLKILDTLILRFSRKIFCSEHFFVAKNSFLWNASSSSIFGALTVTAVAGSLEPGANVVKLYFLCHCCRGKIS